jgi:hypothetical protein
MPERVLVSDLSGVAFDHDVQLLVPVVAAGGQDHVRVGAHVGVLLRLGAGGEVDGSVGPDRDDRGDISRCPFLPVSAGTSNGS